MPLVSENPPKSSGRLITKGVGRLEAVETPVAPAVSRAVTVTLKLPAEPVAGVPLIKHWLVLAGSTWIVRPCGNTTICPVLNVELQFVNGRFPPRVLMACENGRPSVPLPSVNGGMDINATVKGMAALVPVPLGVVFVEVSVAVITMV